MKLRIASTIAAALIAGVVAALAANTTFFTSIGDQVFPFSPPARDGSAGAIDNMIIGATTPRAATFTSVSNTGGGTVNADAITAHDASLGITGLAAAQGGAIAVVGGTSSTAGNAGGAFTAVGGTPGATGVGGAVTFTGGAGGATSGTGGAASLIGGAGTAGNAIGGAATLRGGAGQGSAAGGAVTITGGAAGATGAGGAVSITAGALTAGNGSDVTVTASAGAGSTNAGGSVNLVPGAAVSTGTPGTIKINGDANLVCPTFYQQGAAAANTDAVFFIANRPYIVTSAREVHAVAAGGASVVQLVKDTGTDAPGAGTDLLTNNANTGFDLNATANTVQTGTLVATVATLTLAAGNRLSVDFANAVQASSGIAVTVCLAPL
jgi:hypothetical protein